MTADNENFRNRLIAAQVQDEQLKAKYQQEIRAMLEHKLNPPVRALLITLIILCTLAAALTLGNFSRIDPELAVPGLTFELAMAACLGWIIWRGTLTRAAQGFVLAGVVGGFSICAAGYLADTASYLSEPNRLPLVVLAVVTLVLGWLPMALVVVSHYHGRTQERLLEIQYQLAELKEEVRRHR